MEYVDGTKRGVRVRTILIIVFTFFTVAILVAAMASMLLLSTNAIKKQAQVTSEQIVNQTAITVGNYIDDLTTAVDYLKEGIESADEEDDINVLADAVLSVRPNITSVQMYRNSANVYRRSLYDIKSDITVDLSDFSDKLTGTYYVSQPHVSSILKDFYPWVVTVLTKADYHGEVIVAADFTFSQLARTIDSVGIGERGYSFIKSRGQIIYHPQQQLINLGLKQEEESFVADSSDVMREFKDRIYVNRNLANCEWAVVGVSYTDELISNQQDSVAIITAIIFSAIFIVAIATAFIVSHKLTSPADRLVDAMADFEKDVNKFTETKRVGVYEIDRLTSSFVNFEHMISRLIERIKKEEKDLKKTELSALQSQINPHFLYNTLDSILWMCEMGKNKEASEMVSALSKLFRITISKGKEFITLEDEFAHAENYLKIQKVRYNDKFDYKFSLPEELKSLYCNKITVQPFLENSLNHGFDNTADSITLEVSAELVNTADSECVKITVKDNGLGMDEVTLARVKGGNIASKGGIGVKNVNRRIKIFFGEQYGVDVSSELDKGTVVTVTFPVLTAPIE